MKLIKNSKNFNYLLALIMCFFSYKALTNNLITSYNILSWILIVVLLLAFTLNRKGICCSDKGAFWLCGFSPWEFLSGCRGIKRAWFCSGLE